MRLSSTSSVKEALIMNVVAASGDRARRRCARARGALRFLMIGVTVLSTCRQAWAGGFFVPRNGSCEGRIGRAHVLFDATAGGALEVVEGEWPELRRLSRSVMAFRLREDGKEIEVSQALDRSPELIPLEEGNRRIGMRVKFKLYDPSNIYRGYGMTEVWGYPNGEFFVTSAASFEGMATYTESPDLKTVKLRQPTHGFASIPKSGEAKEAVTDAQLRISCGPKTTQLFMGSGPIAAGKAISLPLSDPSLAGRYTAFGDGGKPALGVYWRSGNVEYSDFVSRRQDGKQGAPTYYRWPSYLKQTFYGKSPDTVEIDRSSFCFRWTRAPGALPNPTFTVAYRLVVPESVDELKSLVAAEREPISIKVTGGVPHGNPNRSKLLGYNDQEGIYVVRKTADAMVVSLPADALKRTVRVKAVALLGNGAVVTRLDGKAVVPHLATDGGIADDPLAPIRTQPEGPANAAIVTVTLGDRPQELSFSEADGVQLAYQERDPWRNIACFTSKGGRRYSGFKFSLADGRLRDIRGYGQREWALKENQLAWFSWCGFTPEQVIDTLSEFEIVKNGPEEALFRYLSRNARDRAQSEYEVRVPAASSAMQINVTATFTVLESWPYPSAQFFDVFPFRGVEPEEWWYDEVLFMAPDGRVKWMRTREWTFHGDKALDSFAGSGFLALYSADRGNMLMLTKDFKPVMPASYIICGNYIDFHMALRFGSRKKPQPPRKGFRAQMSYDLAIWGDGKTSREQLIEIGKKSIRAGRLVLPVRAADAAKEAGRE